MILEGLDEYMTNGESIYTSISISLEKREDGRLIMFILVFKDRFIYVIVIVKLKGSSYLSWGEIKEDLITFYYNIMRLINMYL